MPTVLAVRKTSVRPKALEELLGKQAAETAEQPGSKYDHDRYGFLGRETALSAMPRSVVSERLNVRVLYLPHHPRLAGHPDGLRMFYNLRRA